MAHNDGPPPHHPLKIVKPLLRTLLRFIRNFRVIERRLQTASTIPQPKTSASEPNAVVKRRTRDGGVTENIHVARVLVLVGLGHLAALHVLFDDLLAVLLGLI